MKFTELDLKPKILKALDKMGYTDLTPIQEETFPHIIAGKDIIALAETGSGKTSACGIPVGQKIDVKDNSIQALIVVPTRELALQYVSAIDDIVKFEKISAFAVYGGFPIDTQKAKLNHGVHILVATPGRLIDLIYNSPLDLSNVQTLILDEADEMLNMGFVDDIEFIIACLVHDHQTLLFSATMPREIQRLAKKYLKEPMTLALNADQVAPQSLIHKFKKAFGHNKIETLRNYIKEADPQQAILFCNSRRNCEKLYDYLRDEIKSVEMIHAGLEQSKRSSLFNRFKKKQVKFIVATDIASRGLDFSHVTDVINYDFPNNPQAYTHRSGRTARMGRKGTAITFFGKHDLRSLRQIIKDNNIEPVWLSEEPDLKNAPKSSGGRSYHGKSNKKNWRPRKNQSPK